MRALPLLALLAMLTLPPVSAKADGPDFRVGVTLRDSPTYDGPEGWLHLVEATPGERYVWNVSVPVEYATGELHVTGLDLQRPRQLVPTLETPGGDFPLFEPYPNERVWEADGPVRVFHVSGAAADFTLRLGLPGGNGTLVLQRDVAPPSYTLGPFQNVTHRDFYRESRTDELALGDLQVREAGAAEWVQNPTAVYHFRQNFPVQGLDPATEYETRFVFADWAGNNVTSPVERLTTLAAPVRPTPVVTALDPAPNATVSDAALVVVRARIVSDESPIEGGDIRLFLDKKEVREGLVFDGEVFSYQPPQTLAPGPHSVSVEATNAAGGTGVARWSFTVGGKARESPAPGLLPMALLGLGAALLLRRR